MFTREELQQATYGNFDFGRFRDAAAALIKYVIRAREKQQPQFLGGDEEYARWNLALIEKDKGRSPI
jgi:hypothetical protein